MKTITELFTVVFLCLLFAYPLRVSSASISEDVRSAFLRPHFVSEAYHSYSLERQNSLHEGVKEIRKTAFFSYNDSLRKRRQRSAELSATAGVAVGKATEITMPTLSSTMEEGKIVAWKKQIADKVEVGDTLMVVESDKADMDVESFSSGYLAAHYVKEGESAAVYSTVGLLVDRKEDVEHYRRLSKEEALGGSPPAAAAASTTPASSIPEKSAEMPAQSKPTASADMSNLPAHKLVEMPALSSTMSEGKVISWSKKVGDRIQARDTLMVVESDKADMDVEAFDEGFLAGVFVEEGESAKVGEPVGILCEKKEDVGKFAGLKSVSQISSFEKEAVSESSTTVSGEASTRQSAVPTHTASTSFVGENFIPATVDQDIAMQLPEGKTTHDLAQEFYKRLALTEIGRDYIAKLQADSVKGKQRLELMTDRAKNRVPSYNILAADMPARGGSLWNASSSTKSHQTFSLLQSSAESSLPSEITLATPAAQKAAKELKVDVQSIKGTGVFGRITIEDVMNAAGRPSSLNSSAAKPAVEEKRSAASSGKDNQYKTAGAASSSSKTSHVTPMTSVQKAIAKNMTASLKIPVFRISASFNSGGLEKVYETLKPRGIKYSVLLAKAVATTLKKHPLLTAKYSEENGGSIVFQDNVDIAMAVSVEDSLLTPVLRSADSRSVSSLSKDWKTLVEKARSNKLSAAEMASPTFMISNLGMYNVDQFDAVLPEGLGTIMAVSSSQPVVEADEDEDEDGGLPYKASNRVTVTLTCDHRHIYGSHAADFLKDLVAILEDDPVAAIV